MRRWLQGFRGPPTRKELLVGGLAGLVIGSLGFVLPTLSIEVTLISLAVGITVVVFVRWRWGETIDRWFRG